MKVLQIGIAGVVLVSLASCSTLGSNGKRIDYGAAAVQVPTLEVPPDLTAPVGSDRYKVPQADAGSTATYSDYSKGGKPSQTGVLPEVPGVHMEHNKSERWLVVDQKAEDVWPVVKAFWEDLGLSISSEDETAGVMETAWAENRAKKLPGNRNILGNEDFDIAYEVSERDKYLTRLARGKDGASTEVHITHRGLREDHVPGKYGTQWSARPEDAELEAIMLQRLMARFGVNDATAAKEVAVTGAAPSAAPAAPEVTEPAGSASLREIGGNTLIMVNDTFDRSWRKAGLAIEGAGLKLEDKDRQKGIYYLGPVKLERSWFDKLKFWKSSEDTTRHYRVHVKDGGKTCEVFVVDQDGASNKVSKQLTVAIYKNFIQQ